MEQERKPASKPVEAAAPGEMTGLLPFRLDEWDAKKAREIFLSGRTDLGKIFAPLVKDLDAMSWRLKKDFRNYECDDWWEKTMQHFEAVHRHMGRVDLTDAKLEVEDLVFLMSDKVGALLRRPILKTWLADKLKKELVTEGTSERDFTASIVQWMRAQAWSNFVNDKEIGQQVREQYPDVLMDEDKLATQVE